MSQTGASLDMPLSEIQKTQKKILKIIAKEKSILSKDFNSNKNVDIKQRRPNFIKLLNLVFLEKMVNQQTDQEFFDKMFINAPEGLQLDNLLESEDQ